MLGSGPVTQTCCLRHQPPSLVFRMLSTFSELSHYHQDMGNEAKWMHLHFSRIIIHYPLPSIGKVTNRL